MGEDDHDEALGKMQEAYAALNAEKSAGKASRELAVAMTELETAILWRQHDLGIKSASKAND